MARRLGSRRTVDVPQSAKWLTTFNDLITLMMVFFVLLFAMSKGDMEKIKQFRSAIIQGFGVLDKKDQGTPGLIETTKPSVMTGGNARQNPVPEAMRELIQEVDALPEVEMVNAEKGMILRISGNILFSSGSASINPEGISLLKKIGASIRRLPNRVRIEGHTDNMPISTATFPSNWELSAARAVNIVKFLSDHTGVYPRRLSAVGYGESRPIRDNLTVQNRAMNRRVEIVLLKKKGT